MNTLLSAIGKAIELSQEYPDLIVSIYAVNNTVKYWIVFNSQTVEKDCTLIVSYQDGKELHNDS